MIDNMSEIETAETELADVVVISAAWPTSGLDRPL